ncbi:Hypothetical protein CINCED_3A004908 [Cinara cedri]|uniref:Uncharacterized protein n=1 Tax=Cinara cedri TaxID=506608 RepID=A0A5E4MNN9_9HEMI|nr:Hypothetical protein CINCED_3A004908 [Cinara cedri]
MRGSILRISDGTVVLARTRQEVKSVLMRAIYEPRLIVNSIITVPCGGSLDSLMVTVTGKTFTQVFIAELRPERPLTYVIVSSLTQQFFAGPVADRQTLETRFAGGDCPADTGVDRMPKVGLKPKEHVGYAPNLATRCKTSPEITQSDIAAKILQHILLHIPPPEIQISRNVPSSLNTLTGYTHSVISTKNPPSRILSPVCPNPVNIFTSHQPFQNTCSYRVPFDTFHPMKNVPQHIGPIITASRFPLIIFDGPHQLSANTFVRPQHLSLRPLLLYHYYVGRYDNV